MHLAIHLLRGTVPAEPARQRSLAGVRSSMFLNMVQLGESHAAYVACIRSLFCVCANVGLKIASRCKGSVAYLAFKGPLTCVCADMGLEIGLPKRRVGTMWTGV